MRQTAYNRAYLATLCAAKIPRWETSDTLETLYDISADKRDNL